MGAVPAAFKAQVAAHLARARSDAFELMPLPDRTLQPNPVIPRAGARCRGCGCHVADRSPGCQTCNARHGQRAWENRRRAGEGMRLFSAYPTTSDGRQRRDRSASEIARALTNVLRRRYCPPA